MTYQTPPNRRQQQRSNRAQLRPNSPRNAFKGWVVYFRDQRFETYARNKEDAINTYVMLARVRKTQVQYVIALPADLDWKPITTPAAQAGPVTKEVTDEEA